MGTGSNDSTTWGDDQPIELSETEEEQELKRSLSLLLAYLLQWHFTNRRNRSWKQAVDDYRRAIVVMLDKAPNLKNNLRHSRWIAQRWTEAALIMGNKFKKIVFPGTKMWEICQILDYGFYPD